MNNKDLLKQYCDTGLELTPHQIKNIPNSLKSTYMRKRIQTTEHGSKLNNDEWNLCDVGTKNKYINNIITTENDLQRHEFMWCSKEQIQNYLQYASKVKCLDAYEFEKCTLYQKGMQIVLYRKNRKTFDVELFSLCDDSTKIEYIEEVFDSSLAFNIDYFNMCSDKVKEVYLTTLVFKNIPPNPDDWEQYDEKYKYFYYNLLVKYNTEAGYQKVEMEDYIFLWLTDQQKLTQIGLSLALVNYLNVTEEWWYNKYVTEHPELGLEKYIEYEQ